MAEEFACIVFLPSSRGKVEEVEQRLISQGYQVHTFEITNDRAAAVKSGDWGSLPKELADCLEEAALVVFLIDEGGSLLGPIAGLGSDAGCRVVSIGGGPSELPEGLDDVIDGHIPNVNAPDADDIIGGKPDRIESDGQAAPPRKPKRVKCQ